MKRRRRVSVLSLAALLAFLPIRSLGVSAAEQVQNWEKVILKLDVDVGEENCNSASFHQGELHTWIIRSSVPADIADARVYEVRNQLDYRLTPEADSIQVLLHTGKNGSFELKQDVHYLLTETLWGEEKEGNREILLALTREGMAFAGKHSAFTESRLEITFQASINSRCSVGEGIQNMATLRYTDPSGKAHGAESDRAEVHTGGVVLLKTDGDGNPLAGAQFRIARVTAGFGTDILMLEEEVIPVAYQQFHGTRDLSDGKVTTVVTGDDGIAVMYGLAYGTYYIVETKAPDGYNLLTQPIAVIIDEISHLTAEDGWKDADGRTVDQTVRVINTKFTLPTTGGPGTGLYMVSGLWILAVGLILLAMNLRWKRYG